MLYKDLNIYICFGTKLIFEQKYTQEEFTTYSQLSAFATSTDFKTLILGCLDEFLPTFLQILH